MNIDMIYLIDYGNVDDSVIIELPQPTKVPTHKYL